MSLDGGAGDAGSRKVARGWTEAPACPVPERGGEA